MEIIGSIMRIISVVTGLSIIALHVYFFIALSARASEMKKWLKRFFDEGKLSKEDYYDLDWKTGNASSVLEAGPDYVNYSVLYENPDFVTFVERWRRTRNTCLVTFALLCILFATTTAFFKANPTSV